MAWHFTRIGFFSVTCARVDGKSRAVNKSQVMIRVRLIEHLHNLQAACKEEVPAIAKAEIMVTPDNDYVARIFVPKSAWIAALSMLTDDMDYDNFKSAVARRKRDAYEVALHDVWGVMYNLQRNHEPVMIGTKTAMLPTAQSRVILVARSHSSMFGESIAVLFGPKTFESSLKTAAALYAEACDLHEDCPRIKHPHFMLSTWARVREAVQDVPLFRI